MTDEDTETEEEPDESDTERSQYGGGPEETDAVEQTEMREEEIEPPEVDESADEGSTEGDEDD